MTLPTRQSVPVFYDVGPSLILRVSVVFVDPLERGVPYTTLV